MMTEISQPMTVYRYMWWRIMTAVENFADETQMVKRLLFVVLWQVLRVLEQAEVLM